MSSSDSESSESFSVESPRLSSSEESSMSVLLVTRKECSVTSTENVEDIGLVKMLDNLDMIFYLYSV